MVRKALIPAAGLGTRFLPATKTVPKELFPIIDRPILLYVVEEAVRAGIEDIVLIAGRGKTAIEDFFDTSYELEDKLAAAGKTDWLDTLKSIKSMANIISIRQKEALGLGHAVACGRPILGEEPFAVLLGDELMIPKGAGPDCTTELIQGYRETKISNVAIMKVRPEEVRKYGIVGGETLDNGLIRVSTVVEKPAPETAPSLWALPGRYVFTTKILEHLRDGRPGVNGEIQLTDAMTALARSEGLMARRFTADRYDAGDKVDFLRANIELALRRPDLQQPLRALLKKYSDRDPAAASPQEENG